MSSDGTTRPISVLVVCTGNSARSVMAEVLLRKKGGSDFEVASAGTEPRGVNPLTLRVLEASGLDTSGLRSKSVNEFVDRAWDYVITVCDEARQSCPVFPGSHESLHWGYDDPAAVKGDEETRVRAFHDVFTALSERIGLFVPIALREHGRRVRTGVR